MLEEVALYKEALRKCYKSFGADMIAFEVARSTGKGGHAHVQVSPLIFSCSSLIGFELQDCLVCEVTDFLRFHMHRRVFFLKRVQICPIPASLATQAEKVFLEQGSKFNYDFEEVSDPSTFHSRAVGPGEERTEYFKVDLPGGKSLVHWIKPGTPFSLQFGRYGPFPFLSPSQVSLTSLLWRATTDVQYCSLPPSSSIARRSRFC